MSGRRGAVNGLRARGRPRRSAGARGYAALWVLLPALVACNFAAHACTIGFISGAKTPDGRPIVFKNRDVDSNWVNDVDLHRENAGAAGRSFVFQRTPNDGASSARCGVNAAGLGVVYADAENLSGETTGIDNSHLCALMLRTAATVAQARHLLDSTNGQRSEASNFIVCDSAGNASIFEASGTRYVELSVKDSLAVMANVAHRHPDALAVPSGNTSGRREARAQYQLTHGPAAGVDVRYVVQHVVRDYCTTQADADRMPAGEYETDAVISRFKSVSGAVIRGAKPGDNAAVESVLWSLMGEPSSTIALPLFVNAGRAPARLNHDAADSGMCVSSDKKRRRLYDYAKGRFGDTTMNTTALPPVTTLINAIEASVFGSLDTNVGKWRSLGTSAGPSMWAWEDSTAKLMKAWYDAEHPPVGSVGRGVCHRTGEVAPGSARTPLTVARTGAGSLAEDRPGLFDPQGRRRPAHDRHCPRAALLIFVPGAN